MWLRFLAGVACRIAYGARFACRDLTVCIRGTGDRALLLVLGPLLLRLLLLRLLLLRLLLLRLLLLGLLLLGRLIRWRCLFLGGLFSGVLVGNGATTFDADFS